MFKRIGIIAKQDDSRVDETCRALTSFLSTHQTACLVRSDCGHLLYDQALTSAECRALGRMADLVIVVGGDGTLLRAARLLVDQGVRLLGINLGHLGFLTDIPRQELESQLDAVLSGRYVEEERFLLDARLLRNGEEILRDHALNDVVLQKWNVARLIRFDTYIDGVFVNSQRSDGLIVATPTGSTAYALSGGGPILHPGLDAIALVPVCPHTLSQRPLVVEGRSLVEVVLTPGQQTGAQITFDGQALAPVEEGDRVVICKKDRTIRLVHPPGHDYFMTLRTKLHWGREP